MTFSVSESESRRTPICLEERAKEAEISMAISSLAKHMINNADVVLRAEKLIGEGKLTDITTYRYKSVRNERRVIEWVA